MARPARGFPYCVGPYEHRRKWRVVVYTGRRSDGRRTLYVRAFDSADAASRWRASFESVAKAGGRTIGEAVTEYHAALRRKGNKEASITTSRYRLDAILDTGMALIDLTPRKAQQLYDDLVDEGGAVDTHRGCLIAAKAFGRHCQAQSWISVNPFAAVEPVGRRSKGKEQHRTDEARAYTRYCLWAWTEKRDRSAIAALLPLIMNLRATEVSQLVARDVDDRGRRLHIADTEAKTDTSRRRAKVPAFMVPIMLELAATPATAAGHLFADRKGEPADRHWVAYHARRLMRAAGVKRVTLHGLRGTHASQAVTQGQTADAVASAMGHTDSGVTKAHYIDAEAAADAATDALVAELLDDEDGLLNRNQ